MHRPQNTHGRKRVSALPEADNGIVLRDFYFSYYRKPCLFWKKRFTEQKVGALLKRLAAAGNTVLVATHDPELIELCCDYVLSVENGRLGYMKTVET